MSGVLLLALVLAAPAPLAPAPAIAGIAAFDLDRGRWVERSLAGESFPMASVFKLPLAVAVLQAVDRGELALDATQTIGPADFSPGHSPIRDRAGGKPVTLTVRELLDAAVSDSDNTAGDWLLRIVGGAARVNAAMLGLHIDGIRVDRSEREIIEAIDRPGFAWDERDSATPDAVVALLEALHTGRASLSPASRTLLLDLLTSSRNPPRISIWLPAGAVVAHKTGTMPGVLNDAAIVTTPRGRHLALVILTRDGSGPDGVRARWVAGQAAWIYAEFAGVNRARAAAAPAPR